MVSETIHDLSVISILSNRFSTKNPFKENTIIFKDEASEIQVNKTFDKIKDKNLSLKEALEFGEFRKSAASCASYWNMSIT
ncbi:Hypothetical protein HVR_LOCUS526 [uncultured virus]|nr:Hypothetical protein HVR_LOCUS526 [uncultured virus]